MARRSVSLNTGMPRPQQTSDTQGQHNCRLQMCSAHRSAFPSSHAAVGGPAPLRPYGCLAQRLCTRRCGRSVEASDGDASTDFGQRPGMSSCAQTWQSCSLRTRHARCGCRLPRSGALLPIRGRQRNCCCFSLLHTRDRCGRNRITTAAHSATCVLGVERGRGGTPRSFSITSACIQVRGAERST